MQEKIPPTVPLPVAPSPRSPAPIIIGLVIAIPVLVASSIGMYFLGKGQNGAVATAKPTAVPTSASQIVPTSSSPVVPTSPPVKETTWKTYENTKYSYSMDYPSDWVASEFANSQTGASFDPMLKPTDADVSAAIVISKGNALGSYANLSLEEYVKVAGAEIQNYNTLGSIKKITTSGGTVGYEATWMVQPMTINGVPPTSKGSASLPITFFEIPGNKIALIRVSLKNASDLNIYEKMIATVKISAPLTPLPTIDESATLKYVMGKYIALKHNTVDTSLTITVSKIEGKYAKGGVSDKEGGGGMWYAVKEDGVWKLVWDGNGTIECSAFSSYPEFPINMLAECYDSINQNTVKR
ncbi:MAG: hypothetical protein WCO78_01445 [Candidatus Roizmanbacteria bacterium]